MKEMYSVIDTQSVVIDRLVAPTGKVVPYPPILEPVAGALGYDNVNQTLYLGNGSQFITVNGNSDTLTIWGGVVGDPFYKATFTSTNGSPSLSLYVALTLSFSPPNAPRTFALCTINLVIDQSINISQNDDWHTNQTFGYPFWSPGFADVYFPASVIGSGGAITNLQCCYNKTGNITISNRSGNIGLVYFGNFSTSYIGTDPFPGEPIHTRELSFKALPESSILEGEETPKDDYIS